MFEDASSFDQSVSSFDVSKVESLTKVFKDAASFNNGGEALSWNAASAIDMTALFEGTNANLNFFNFNTSKVSSFERMFANNIAFDGSSVSTLDTSNATSMRQMFDGCTNFRGDVAKFDVSNVQDFSAMFRGAAWWSSDISVWQTSSATGREKN